MQRQFKLEIQPKVVVALENCRTVGKIRTVDGLEAGEAGQVPVRTLEKITAPPTRSEKGSADCWAPKACTRKVLARRPQVAVFLPSFLVPSCVVLGNSNDQGTRGASPWPICEHPDLFLPSGSNHDNERTWSQPDPGQGWQDARTRFLPPFDFPLSIQAYLEILSRETTRTSFAVFYYELTFTSNLVCRATEMLPIENYLI